MTTIIIPSRAKQRPSGKLYLSATQSNLVDGVITVVELNTVVTGFTDGIEDTVNHKITPGHAGFYHITGMVTFLNPVAARSYYAAIILNNDDYRCFHISWAGGGTYFSVPVAALVKLTVTDYIQLWARSDSGDNTVDIQPGVHLTFLSVQRVR